MTDAATDRTPLEPDGAPRLPALDILRGIAILAILFANIGDMGASFYAALGSDPRRLGWAPLDRISWIARELLLSGTARGLLEMLFGAGMVIIADRALTGGAADYVRRNLVLLALGVIHVLILLWPGDILHTYALAALIAMCLRTARPRLMLTLGLSLALFQMISGTLAVTQFVHERSDATALDARGAAGRMLSADEQRRLVGYAALDRRQRQANEAAAARVAAEDRARTGTPRQWGAAAWGMFAFIQTQGYETYSVWEAAGTMLIGAALFRWGVLQGSRSRRFYLCAAVVAYTMGLTLRALAVRETLGDADSPIFATTTSELARLATTLGHVAAVNLMLATAAGARLLRPFAAAGRTALSIYVMQTLICLWVLYPPWGFALYGKQGWAALMLTAVAVNAALLVGANVWVWSFRGCAS